MTKVRLRPAIFLAFLQNFTRNGGCMEIFLFSSVPVLTEVKTFSIDLVKFGPKCYFYKILTFTCKKATNEFFE